MNLAEPQKRREELIKLILFLEKEIAKYPKGNLRISSNGTKCRYYHVTKKGDTRGKYIKKENNQLAIQLANREYYERVFAEANREKQALDRLIKEMSETAPEEIYDNMNEYRKNIITPVFLSDNHYAEWWQNVEYQGNPYEPQQRIYETKRGDKVRSKSEAMIADIYYELGIPYRYEAPYRLYDGRIKYPDFTLLKLPERKEIIHEHLGLLEEEGYMKSNLIKITEYQKSGLCLCDNLFITYETSFLPLNVTEIKKTIRQIFFPKS